MKFTVVISSFLLLLFSLSSCEQKTTDKNIDSITITDTNRVLVTDTIFADPVVKDANDPISSIKQQFSEVNSAQMKVDSFSFMCDEKTIVSYYLLNNEVRKAVVDWGVVGDAYANDQYYYTNGKCFFVYKYNTGGAAGAPVTEHTQRYYVYRDSVIRFLKDGKESQLSKPFFGEQSSPYRVLDAYTSKKFKENICVYVNKYDPRPY